MAKKRSYPANLLEALRINIETKSNINYYDLTDDQKNGLEYALSLLTEREATVFQHYYIDGMTKKAIAERYSITEYMIKKIIDNALRKYRRNKEWLFYISNGYEAHTDFLQQQLQSEEGEYCARCGIADSSHLYYQNISGLNFPARIYNPLSKHGIRTVRDLVIFVCSSDRIRNFGELSAKAVCEILERERLIPENWEIQYCRYTNIPRLDVELNVFKTLNQYK